MALRTTRNVAVAFCALALTTAGCGGDVDSAGTASTAHSTAPSTTAAKPPARQSVTFIAEDFAFGGPASVRSGYVDVEVENKGKEPHQVLLARLSDGATAESLNEKLAANDYADLAAATLVGGPQGAGPGAKASATVKLDPGSYAVLCLIPSESDGVAHNAKGMFAALEVTPAEGPQAAEPEPVATIKLKDFSFDVPADLPVDGTVAVVNEGTQAHELIYYPIVEGRTLDDVKAYMLTPPGAAAPAGPPPIDLTGGGGVTGLSTGVTSWIELDMKPGRYVFVCYYPDPEQSNLPHALEGMLSEVKVSA